MTYRHATNLKTPLLQVDEDFLAVLGDYKVGPPVPPRKTRDNKPYSYDELVERGFIGIYTTPEALRKEAVRRKTGWGSNPEKMLGVVLE